MSDSSGTPEIEGGAELELVVRERKQHRLVRLPRRGQLVIGRSGDCDLSLEDSTISRRHAVLPLDTLRQAPLSATDERPMARASASQLRKLLAGEEAAAFLDAGAPR